MNGPAYNFAAQKAALTRAVKSGDAAKVLDACKKAVREWNAFGPWPDDWARWQRALDDATVSDKRYAYPVGAAPRLEDLR